MASRFVVVGGTSGIGLRLVTGLSAGGAHVHVLSRGNHAGPEGPGIQHHVCDVTEDEPRFPTIEEPIRGLVYLPGSITLRPFHLLRARNFLDDYGINVVGAVKTLQHFLGNLKAASSASVVFVSTVAVQTGLPYHASVASAKGAVEGLTRSLAAELAPSIRVNALAPSLTDTPLAATLLNQTAKRQHATERHPLKRLGTPDEMAASIQFLLSEQSNWITGQILHVDGGLSSVRLL